MSLDVYRTHLVGLDLTDQEINELIETLNAIVVNVVDNLYMELNDHEHCERQAI